MPFSILMLVLQPDKARKCGPILSRVCVCSTHSIKQKLQSNTIEPSANKCAVSSEQNACRKKSFPLEGLKKTLKSNCCNIGICILSFQQNRPAGYKFIKGELVLDLKDLGSNLRSVTFWPCEFILITNHICAPGIIWYMIHGYIPTSWLLRALYENVGLLLLKATEAGFWPETRQTSINIT